MCVCLQIGARDAEVSKLGSYGLGVGLLPVRGKVTGNYRKLPEFAVTEESVIRHQGVCLGCCCAGDTWKLNWASTPTPLPQFQPHFHPTTDFQDELPGVVGGHACGGQKEGTRDEAKRETEEEKNVIDYSALPLTYVCSLFSLCLYGPQLAH